MEKEELKLYNPQEVADILRVSRQTVYNYIHAGKLKSVNHGKACRISEKDLKEFLQSGNN